MGRRHDADSPANVDCVVLVRSSSIECENVGENLGLFHVLSLREQITWKNWLERVGNETLHGCRHLEADRFRRGPSVCAACLLDERALTFFDSSFLHCLTQVDCGLRCYDWQGDMGHVVTLPIGPGLLIDCRTNVPLGRAVLLPTVR